MKRSLITVSLVLVIVLALSSQQVFAESTNVRPVQKTAISDVIKPRVVMSKHVEITVRYTNCQSDADVPDYYNYEDYDELTGKMYRGMLRCEAARHITGLIYEGDYAGDIFAQS